MIEIIHPNSDAQLVYQRLIGIDNQKLELLSSLQLIFNQEAIESWIKTNHKNAKLGILNMVDIKAPLIILSGEVGCGKTALANSIASPLAKVLKTKVTCMESPSDIRGSGFVGELSSKITAVFEAARNKVKTSKKPGILIIDEADDLATSRSQNQAHHEDRAGLNVLIKQIDQIKKERVNLAVILITNRLDVLDPAVRRRSAVNLTFSRPGKDVRRTVFEKLLEGTVFSKDDVKRLGEIASKKEIPYSYSDLIDKVGQQALLKAVADGNPFDHNYLESALRISEPSPLLKNKNT